MLKEQIFNNDTEWHKYITNLTLYEKWDEENKLLIYYEDLISDPRGVITRLLNFLHEEVDCIESFMKDYQKWSKEILDSYCQNKPYAYELSSGGNKEVFHSKGFSDESLVEIDNHIEKTYPNLWYKYLRRYKN